MNVRTGSTRAHDRALKVTIAVALALGVTVAGSATAGAAQQRSLVVTATLTSSGGSEIGGLVRGRGPLPGMLRGRSKLPARRAVRGDRQLGIIAILVGLKADRRYQLALSVNGCRRGAGGVVGSPIAFDGGPDGSAFIEQGNLHRQLLGRARSLVVLSPDSGDAYQACGRLVTRIVGDFDGDGRPPIGANARLRTRLPSGGQRAEGLVQARRRGRQLGIIAVLVGLRPVSFQGSETFTYTFALSRNGCRKASGGLVGKPIQRWPGSSEAHAVVTGRTGVGALRRAQSVVLLSSETGDRYLACGRIDIEYSADGNDL